MILGANDNDGRYREDKSMTFFKQVSVKLEIRVSEEPRGAQKTSFPESSWRTSRKGSLWTRLGGGWGPLGWEGGEK